MGADGGAVRVLVSGASGLVGSALEPALKQAGFEVSRLVRRAPRGPAEHRWDPDAGALDPAALDHTSAVVHLAGASVGGGRWTRARREQLIGSRTRGTRLLARAIAARSRPPGVLVSASAAGYYGDRGDEVLTEDAPAGAGFLARLAREWEGAAREAETAGVRVVRLRTGLVLAPRAEALAKMALPFRLGFGGPLGSGRQWWCWIALEDLIAAILHVLLENLAGAVNAVAPGCVPNAEFMRALGRALSRPALVPAPALALRALLGRDFADDMLLSSQRVVPARLVASGFRFRFPEVEPALRHALGREARA